MTVKLRYKQPDGDTSKLITRTVDEAALHDIKPSENLQFASAVAEFGLLLRNSEHKGNATYSNVLQRAKGSKGSDTEGYRAEFIRLVEKAKLLDTAEQ
ncbi:MAG: YfbK domain-containing protein [Pontiella sp.]